MKILVINTGSSSIKYKLFEMAGETMIASGVLEKIGEEESHLVHRVNPVEGNGEEEIELRKPVADHAAGLDLIVHILTDHEKSVLAHKSDISAIGHRVVHGGEFFQSPVLIDARVVAAVKENIPLAPLHNPANLAGIETAIEFFPDTPQAAVFDTAFHQTIPPRAFRYALPKEMYTEHRIRRYGFHGASHHYVAQKAAAFIGIPLDSANFITAHLGNGASLAAVKNGLSVDTTMGMTPLEGLFMGTRCGDVDPAVHFYLADHLGMTMDEINVLMNKQSGLKGLCGANDMREVIGMMKDGDADAALAVDIYTYRIRKYIGAYFAVLGRVDAIVFTGGIGENSPEIRSKSCHGLEFMGVNIDDEKNLESVKDILEIETGDGVKILVVRTNEELEIARRTAELLA